MDAVSNHATARASLIAKERALSHHHIAYPLSPTEAKAVALISELRAKELQTIWSDEADPKVWLGMPFTSSKALMEKSKLFSLIKQMPKGGVLHCHLDAMNDAHALLRLAFSLNDNLCISASESLATKPSALITFSTLSPTSPPFDLPPPSIESSAYIPDSLVPAHYARSVFTGGPKDFDANMIARLTVKPESVTWSQNEVWEHFASTFHVAGGLLGFEPVWEAYIVEVFARCAEDQVPYLGSPASFLIFSLLTRPPQNAASTSSTTFMVSSSGHFDLPHRAWVSLFNRASEAVKAASTPSKPFWGARIIYSTIRFIDPGAEKGQLRWYMEDCIALKREFPALIAGFDLVGWEDGLRPLSDYIEDLLWFVERQKEVGLDIPYLFHAGETLGDGSKADMNLYDAILLGTKRIGHGFSLPQHPLLMEICKERKIAVECCPISNELLRYTTSTPAHPLAVLLNNAVPVALACDDPQFFGNRGLSYDFYQVFTSSEQMTILGLGKLARQSIEFSRMPEGEKGQRLVEYDQQFAAFLELVVASATQASLNVFSF